jgi:sugar O-acyltransferase (sialic acid O-acetyltransferase NeuD family)
MSEPTRVLGLGAGGHARVVLDALRRAGEFEVAGFLDPDPTLWGSSVDGVPVLGGDELLEGHYDGAVSHAFIGLGGAGDTRPRRRLYELACARGYEIVSVVDPSALVSPSASVGRGATILQRAVVNAAAALDVIVNTGAIIEHDCRVGDHVHVASGAVLASGVVVDDGAHVGAGAVVRQGIRIGAGAVVGAGAAVVADVEPGMVVVGVPASVLRPVEER